MSPEGLKNTGLEKYVCEAMLHYSVIGMIITTLF